MDKKTNLVWVDLEMTGLDPSYDVIVEIALIITDGDLNMLHRGPSLVIHHTPEVLQKMGPWVLELHTKSGLLDEITKSTVTTQEAEEQTLEVLREYCIPRMSPLCGNSVWQDAAFLKRHMPRITDFLHYRILDVTSIKEALARWYPHDPQLSFYKKDMHRAMIDIEESIDELNHYRRNFFKPSE